MPSDTQPLPWDDPDSDPVGDMRAEMERMRRDYEANVHHPTQAEIDAWVEATFPPELLDAIKDHLDAV